MGSVMEILASYLLEGMMGVCLRQKDLQAEQYSAIGTAPNAPSDPRHIIIEQGPHGEQIGSTHHPQG
jgi:hypothetical protein